MELVRQLLPLVLQVSLILIVVSVGLQSRWSDFLYALQNPSMLLRGIIAVNIVPPLVAAVLIAIFPLEPAVKFGIIVMAVAPLAPLVPGKMLKVGSKPSFAVGLYVALILLAVAVVPLVLAILSRIFPADADIAPRAIAHVVLLSVLLPLVVGTLIGTLFPAFAGRAAPIAQAIGGIGLLLYLVPVVIILAPRMLALLENGTLIVIALTLAAALAGGHMLGGPSGTDRMALALAAATRHPGIAVMIAHANVTHPDIIPCVILFLLVGMVVSGLYQPWARKSLNHSAPK